MALATATLPLRADPCKSPQRAVSGLTVDLTPLFFWWTKHQGERPLTAWVHVTGTIVATNALGWTVRGTAERRSSLPQKPEGTKSTSPHPGIFILQHPPVQDQARFEQLVAERQRWANALSDDQNQLRGLAGAKPPRANRRKRTPVRDVAQETANLKQAEAQDQAQLKEIDQQLRPYGVTTSGRGDKPLYRVDSFALDVDQAVNGIPLYDHGASFN